MIWFDSPPFSVVSSEGSPSLRAAAVPAVAEIRHYAVDGAQKLGVEIYFHVRLQQHIRLDLAVKPLSVFVGKAVFNDFFIVRPVQSVHYTDNVAERHVQVLSRIHVAEIPARTEHPRKQYEIDDDENQKASKTYFFLFGLTRLSFVVGNNNFLCHNNSPLIRNLQFTFYAKKRTMSTLIVKHNAFLIVF